ncbi:hypothetical protein BaRGS_00007650, partial [Batillaria attramentaria]
SSPQCTGNNYLEDGKMCYYYYNTPRGWGEAKAECQDQQGLLVIFDTPKEASQVLNDIRQEIPDARTVSEFWVGLQKEGDQTYIFSDGSSLKYNKWEDSISNDVTSTQGCVSISVTSDSVVAAVKDCSTEISFICQVNSDKAVWTGWSTWGDCSATCDQGTRTRHRMCLQANENVGNCNGDSTEEEACTTTLCPLQAGELRSTGSKVNYNTAKAECEAQGAQLPVLTSQAEHDALLAFARDNTGKNNEVWLGLYYTGSGDVYQWVDGTMTSSGTFTKWAENEPDKQDTDMAVILHVKDDEWRTRKETDKNHTEDNVKLAAFHWATWGDWSACNVSCGGGQMSRSRQCVDNAGGIVESTQCPGDKAETQDCNTDACTDYAWETWGEWSACSTTCGEGQKSRSRRCVDTVSGNLASECQGDTTETRTCDEGACAVPASWASWQPWSACSVTCGTGERTRQRSCSTGLVTDCGSDWSETKSCNAGKCPDIFWGTWSEWGACSQSCGGGQRSRSRRCVDSASGTEAQDQNECKGKDSEKENCNKQKCPKASWEEWAQWTVCSTECGKGRRSRVRTCSLDGAPSDDCKGKDSDEKNCVKVKCKGKYSFCLSLSKKDIVETLKDDMDVKQLAKLVKWAESTQHMSENIFNSKSLNDWRITGHVIESLPVPSRMRCVLKCMGTDGCKSFNFNISQVTTGTTRAS